MEEPLRFNVDEFIPSKTYRDFLHKNNIELTPRQIAKLIHQYGKTYESRWNAYQQLINDPRTDGDLLENLKKIIAYEKPFVEQELKEISAAVYVLEEYDPEDDYKKNEVGIFPSIRIAEKIGRSIGHEFLIKRHILKELSDEEIKEYAAEYLDNSVCDTCEQEFHYDENGKLKQLYYTNKGDGDNKEYSLYEKADDSLEDIFADYPLCFENGDVIIDTYQRYLKEHYGIIHIRPDRLEEIKRISSIPRMHPDDEYLTEFLYNDGEFGHDHLMVTELERVDIDDKSIPYEVKDILYGASLLAKGRGTIEYLQYCSSQMKQK